MAIEHFSQNMLLKNPLLIRYWFYTGPVTGYGVTAFSLDDAKNLLFIKYGLPAHALEEIEGIIEDVDLQTLNISHVRRNMGPPNFRGVWYPRFNLSEPIQQIYQL